MSEYCQDLSTYPHNSHVARLLTQPSAAAKLNKLVMPSNRSLSSIKGIWWCPALHASNPHIARHGLADYSRLARAHIACKACELALLVVQAVTHIEFGSAHNIGQRDGASNPKAAVHHRQRLDTAFAQQRSDLLQRRCQTLL